MNESSYKVDIELLGQLKISILKYISYGLERARVCDVIAQSLSLLCTLHAKYTLFKVQFLQSTLCTKHTLCKVLVL